jgi:hypothetical protein
MADKYIKQESGMLKEVEATDVSTGTSEAGDVVALNPQGKIDESMLPTGIGADVAVIEASEDLNAGDVVNIYDDAGSPKCRKADATTIGKKAHGFVLAATLTGEDASIYFEGTDDQVTGIPIGELFLSTTPGQVTNLAPSGTGQIVQHVGVGISATSFNFEESQSIELA